MTNTDIEFLNFMREYLIENGILTLPYLKWAIREASEHPFTTNEEKQKIIDTYQILLDELE